MPKFKYLTPALLLTATLLFPLKTLATDTILPVTTVTQTPASPDGKNNWYVSPVTFNLEATDLDSGIKEINYRIDSGVWQKASFDNSLNLAPNPSFETSGSTTSGLASWEATVSDPEGTYSQDTSQYLTGYQTSSAKMVTTAGTWHGINNKNAFSVTTPFDNMSASVWLKTTGVTGLAYFKVYAVTPDGNGGYVDTLINQSSTVTGTVGWTRVYLDFIVNVDSAVGVYMDVGLSGPGTLWADAAVINSSTNTARTSTTISTDNTNHIFEYYSADNALNTETYSCTSNPKKNCITFKSDITAPGNWHDSGAFRGFFGSNHELYVYTNVEDQTSGLSTFTDKYQYRTELNPTFGRFSNLLGCNSAWQPNQWASLFSPPFTPGSTSAYLITQKTDFCNSNWKICKIVRFYSEDMAGNADTKDLCINGPWIKSRGGANVRSNYNIDMISEPVGDNTDGLIEAGGSSIDFFTSTKDWKVTGSLPIEEFNYQRLWDLTDTKTQVTYLTNESGIFFVNGNFEIKNTTFPAKSYGSTTHDQIIFVNGDLKISVNISTGNTSTALFIVKGKVDIAKAVDTVKVAIFADGTFNTAYDLIEGQTTKTLNLNGVYSADVFNFQRTLQGTDNDLFPSENFVYEPKFLINLKQFFGGYSVIWKKVE